MWTRFISKRDCKAFDEVLDLHIMKSANSFLWFDFSKAGGDFLLSQFWPVLGCSGTRRNKDWTWTALKKSRLIFVVAKALWYNFRDFEFETRGSFCTRREQTIMCDFFIFIFVGNLRELEVCKRSKLTNCDLIPKRSRTVTVVLKLLCRKSVSRIWNSWFKLS